MAKIAARRTGNKKVTYRWLADIGGGVIVHAQKHAAASVTGVDTWSSDVDARIPRSTTVEVPAGLLVLDSEKSGSAHEYAAGVTRDAAPGESAIDWSRARYVATKERADKPGAKPVRVHVIEVDGVRGEYVEVAS